MRIFSFFPVLVALVTAVVAVPADNCEDAEMPCQDSTPSKRGFFGHPSRAADGTFTNAELLRRGLRLKDPLLRRGTPVRRTQPSSTPDNGDTGSDNIVYTGVIEVLDSNNNILGYISKNFVNGGAQSGWDPSLSNALTVTFTTDQTGSGTNLDIVATDSNPSWYYLGLVQGRDDNDSVMQAGSYEYGYIAGVAAPGTNPGDPPTLIDNSYFIGAARTAETAVWSYDANTGDLTPYWVNPDLSTPSIQYFTQSTGLYFSGDEAAFVARYPAPATIIQFKFVPS